MENLCGRLSWRIEDPYQIRTQIFGYLIPDVSTLLCIYRMLASLLLNSKAWSAISSIYLESDGKNKLKLPQWSYPRPESLPRAPPKVQENLQGSSEKMASHCPALKFSLPLKTLSPLFRVDIVFRVLCDSVAQIRKPAIGLKEIQPA